MCHEIVQCKDGTIDVDTDPMTTKIERIETLSKTTCNFLKSLRYGLNELVMEAMHALAPVIGVSEPLSNAHHEEIAQKSSAGNWFHAAGGATMNCDDFFLAQEKEEEEKRRFRSCRQISSFIQLQKQLMHSTIYLIYRTTKGRNARKL